MTEVSKQSELSTFANFKRNPLAMIGLAVLVGYLAVALLADVVAPRDFGKTSSATLQAPSRDFLFGTDDLGRDVFSGVMHGTRTSLVIAISVAVLSSCLGLLVGLLAGDNSGLIDDVLMRLTELFLTPPRFFLVLVVAAIFGATTFNLILILSLTLWPLTARLLRAETMSLKERGFVEASRALGASRARILWHEILPHLMPLLVINTVVRLGNVILIEASLEFLGLGDQNYISWGYLLHNGQHFMRDAWWMVAFPILAISLLLIALNIVGDELNQAFNPKNNGNI